MLALGTLLSQRSTYNSTRALSSFATFGASRHGKMLMDLSYWKIENSEHWMVMCLDENGVLPPKTMKILRDWCFENCNEHFFEYPDGFEFISRQDAMAFVLRWA